MRKLAIPILTLLLVFKANLVSAQFVERFEDPKPSWQRANSDCIIPKAKWVQRRSNEVEKQNRFEKIFLQSSQGTSILIAHDAPPAFLIPELKPSVRIKASKAGTRFHVRVVLPRTPAPHGDGPMTKLLSGQAYSETGNWQTIGMGSQDLKSRLKEEVWLLRKKFGSHVDATDAYVDKVVLNIYSGPGELNLQIDDLEINGIASAASIARHVETIGVMINRKRNQSAVQQAGHFQEIEKPKSIVTRDGSVLVVKRNPFFPIIIQSNGEPFDYLKSLGFNTIELPNAPTGEELRIAQELDLWLIAPPPNSIGLNPLGFEYDRVLCWKIGESLTGKDLELVSQRIREIREADPRSGRPVLGQVKTNWTQFGRLLDVVGIGMEPIGSSFFASQYSNWIQQRVNAIGRSKPIWADIQTELSESLREQVNAIALQAPPIPIDPQQMKFMLYEAVTGGARGLRFVSRSRLDSPDPVSRLRAQTIEWLNIHLNQIKPWALGGAVLEKSEAPMLIWNSPPSTRSVRVAAALSVRLITNNMSSVMFPCLRFVQRFFNVCESGVLMVNQVSHQSPTPRAMPERVSNWTLVHIVARL